MRLRYRLVAAVGTIVPACAAPAAHRGRAADHSAPQSGEAGPEAVTTTSTEPASVSTDAGLAPASVDATTTTVFVVTVPTDPPTTTTVRPRPLPATTLPERTGESLTDDEWWATQPGFVPGACGGSLPPCWVMRAESGGDPLAVNATGCDGRGCYGKWQFDPRTSSGLGYARTMDQYPEATQDEAARALWAGGRGCGHWGAC